LLGFAGLYSFFHQRLDTHGGDLLLSVEFGKLGVAKSKGAKNEQGRTGKTKSRA
jgi:hypothetical protein